MSHGDVSLGLSPIITLLQKLQERQDRNYLCKVFFHGQVVLLNIHTYIYMYSLDIDSQIHEYYLMGQGPMKMIIMSFFSFFIADCFSHSFHKHLLNTCCVFQALFYTFLLELVTSHMYTMSYVHSPLKETNFTVTDAP